MLSFILKFNKLQFLSVIPLRHENAPLLEPEWKEVIAVIASAALAAAFFSFFTFVCLTRATNHANPIIISKTVLIAKEDEMIMRRKCSEMQS